MSKHFNLLAFFRCLAKEHNFVNSRAKPGYWTCQSCGLRKKQ